MSMCCFCCSWADIASNFGNEWQNPGKHSFFTHHERQKLWLHPLLSTHYSFYVCINQILDRWTPYVLCSHWDQTAALALFSEQRNTQIQRTQRIQYKASPHFCFCNGSVIVCLLKRFYSYCPLSQNKSKGVLEVLLLQKLCTQERSPDLALFITSGSELQCFVIDSIWPDPTLQQHTPSAPTNTQGSKDKRISDLWI